MTSRRRRLRAAGTVLSPAAPSSTEVPAHLQRFHPDDWVSPDERPPAWLCATGLRRAGDPDDFYRDFMNQVAARGPDYYKPDKDDQRRLKVERADALLMQWVCCIQPSERAAARP